MGVVCESRPFGTMVYLVSGGVGDTTCVNITGICRVIAMLFICCVCLSDPISIFLW